MASSSGARGGWLASCVVAVLLGPVTTAWAQPAAEPPPRPPTPPAGVAPLTSDRPPPPPAGYAETPPPTPVPAPTTAAPIYPAPGGPPASGHAPGSAPPQGYVAPPLPSQAATATPLVQPYFGGPIPEGARVEARRRPGLYIPGVVVFAVAYGSALYEYFLYPHDPYIGTLAIPIIGPIVYGAKVDNVTGTRAMNSVLQATGVVLFAIGMRRRQYLVFDVGQRAVALQASVGPHHVGVGLRLL